MKQRVLILGYGEMGHAMEYLLAARHDVRIWSLDGVKGRDTTLEDEVPWAQVILFCLPVNPHHEIASRIAPYLVEGSLCLTIAKGLDDSGRTAAQVFERVFAGRRHFGVMHRLFRGGTLVCQQASDMHGRSWSVILKNVYAILFGVADELRLGDNMRGHLMVAALAELSGIVQAFGGQAHTPFSYAGLGDLLTTATSAGSHHHALGQQLVRGEWSDISGEGVHTLQMVEKYHLFEWRAYPLFSLVRDIVTAPQTLLERVEDYLKQLRETESCAI